jgi:hypothetical protein
MLEPSKRETRTTRLGDRIVAQRSHESDDESAPRPCHDSLVVAEEMRAEAPARRSVAGRVWNPDDG